MKVVHLIKILTAASIVLVLHNSCSKKVLDVEPQGVVTDEDLNTPENVEKLVIAAYAAQANDFWSAPFQDMWPWGSVGGGDAYKGGGGINDQLWIHWLEVKTLNSPIGNPGNEVTYKYLYAAVSRINEALRRLNLLTDADLPTRQQRIAEMHFLRANTYFKLKVLFKHIVFVDETIPKEEYVDLSNTQLSDQEGWQWIVDEFKLAIDGLPDVQADAGRPRKSAAQLFLAKTLVFKAYVQDDNHQVTSITSSELNEAIQLFEQVDAAHIYDLWEDFSFNFECVHENGKESVWAIMRSLNDGTADGRIDYGNSLNSPVSAGYGCCGFFQPSTNLANAFKTDANGLPLFDSYNGAPTINSNVDVEANNMDPRIAHTIGLFGMPWKYNPAIIVDASFPRVPDQYGTNMGMKDQELPNSSCWRQSEAFYGGGRNTDVMRYADALLYWAEALVETSPSRFAEALPIINRIRQRAMNSTGRLVKGDGSPSGKYVIGLYTAGDFATQEQARAAVRFERRLEMAMESFPGRHFDLVRWGIAEETMNAYYAVEKTRRSYLVEGGYTKGRDEYQPIPQIEITISKGKLQQNPGY
ncbi:MAG: RagB/SusD family nutrient uptake outer membrane protein [Chitinophagaceae bacterium]|nr:RagB/SusD family nutrient uptake outer membrane protein [Chitinophagaceae bacterium]